MSGVTDAPAVVRPGLQVNTGVLLAALRPPVLLFLVTIPRGGAEEAVVDPARCRQEVPRPVLEVPFQGASPADEEEVEALDVLSDAGLPHLDDTGR